MIGDGDDEDDNDDIFKKPSGLFSAPSNRPTLFGDDRKEVKTFFFRRSRIIVVCSH
jgi:hypothetical protein